MQKLENKLLQKELPLREQVAQPAAPAAAPAAAQPRPFKLADPDKYCGGEKELEMFLATLKSNFCTHAYQFSNDEMKVVDAISNLDT